MRARLLPFAIKAIGFFLAGYLVWYFIGPWYDRWLVWVVDGLSPSQVTLIEGNGIAWYHGRELRGVWSTGLHYGVILVIALVAATPGMSLWKRSQSALVALTLVFAVHVVTLLALAGTEFSADPILKTLLLPIGCNLFPIVIYAALTLRYWRAEAKRLTGKGKTKSRIS